MSRFLPFLVAGAMAQQILEETKNCPLGFEFVGKQCVKTIAVAPRQDCPPGTSPDGCRCVRYLGKLASCQPGFELVDGLCQSVRTAEPLDVCAAGFIRSEQGCIRHKELPVQYNCQAGAVAKGDTCYQISTCEPELACAPGALLSGNLCITEETYDCTPAVGEPGVLAPQPCGAVPAPGPLGATQSALLRAKAKFAATGKDCGCSGDANVCQLCAAGQPCGACGGDAGAWPASADIACTSRPRFVEETLVSARCKRISVEPATKLCVNGRLEGKLCVVETPVDAIAIPGGFATELQPAQTICPAGFAPETLPCGTLTCTRLETSPVIFECPCGTTDLGDRCAIISEQRVFCEEGFHLINDLCTQTQYAEPIVEYTVRYTCAGKDCATV